MRCYDGVDGGLVGKSEIAAMTQRYTHLSMKMRQSAISSLPPIDWRKKGTKRTQKKSGGAEANF